MTSGRWFSLLVIAALLCVTGSVALAAEAAAESSNAAPTPDTAETPKKATLDTRLTGLQKALEKYAAARWHRMPDKIEALVEYLPDEKEGLLNPETGKPIIMNQTMANQHETTIREPKTFITFYADAPTKDKGTGCIYATGEIKYHAAKDFRKALAASVTRRLTVEERAELREAAQERNRAARAARRR